MHVCLLQVDQLFVLGLVLCNMSEEYKNLACCFSFLKYIEHNVQEMLIESKSFVTGFNCKLQTLDHITYFQIHTGRLSTIKVKCAEITKSDNSSQRE